MASHSRIARRGQISAEPHVPGRWLRHDANLTPIAVLASLILLTFAAIGAIEFFGDLTRWWLGR